MQIKGMTKQGIDLTHLKLAEAVPEMQIEIYRHLLTGQLYIRHLDGRLELVSWLQTGLHAGRKSSDI
jgi:hypothetical protein